MRYFLLLLILNLPSFAVIGPDVIWEVTTGGSDTNGCGFEEGASGTDHTYPTSTPVSRTDIVIDAVTNTNITSASDNFASDDVGNVINITSGTGFTLGRYTIDSVAAGVATLDRAVGTVGSTGGNGTDGGSCASLGEVISDFVIDNRVWIKSGTYTITSNSTNVSGGKIDLNPQASSERFQRIGGYNSTRGDLTGAFSDIANRPVIQYQSSLTPSGDMIFTDQSGYVISDLVLDANGETSGDNLFEAGGQTYLVNVKIIGGPINIAFQKSAAFNVYSTNSNTFGVFSSSDNVLNNVYVDNPATYGITLGETGRCFRCIVNEAGTDSFVLDGGIYIYCTSYNPTSDGYFVDDGGSTVAVSYLISSIAENSGGWGIQCDTTGDLIQVYNFAFNNDNTSGDIDTDCTVITEVGTLDTATTSFFNDAASEDFSLNNNATGGMLLKDKGYPVSNDMAGGTMETFENVGAVLNGDSPDVTIYIKGPR